MKKLSISQKTEALNNSLASFKFPQKYFISLADARLGQRFAISEKTENGGLSIHSNYMTYDEMNCYLMGYEAGRNNRYK